jgi:antibiotic biosynthesis monooxygenase (ABM) superfamily enzyme
MVEGHVESAQPGTTAEEWKWKLAVNRTMMSSFSCTSHLSLYLHSFLDLARRYIIPGWISSLLLFIVIPYIMVTLQQRNTEKQQRRSDELPAEVSDSIGIGRLKRIEHMDQN